MAKRAPIDPSKLTSHVKLNNNQKANVFISSRMSSRLFGEELRSLREELKAVLEAAYPFLNVELAEDWTTGHKGSPEELSVAGARWSDLMLGIFVEQPGYRDNAGLHATERELRTALEDSWDKVMFFAHKGLVDSLASQPDGYRELILEVMAYKGGKNVSIFRTKDELFQAVLSGVAGHAAAALRRYPSRTSGKGAVQIAWELQTFSERHVAIQDAFTELAAGIKDIGPIASLGEPKRRQEHVFYRMAVKEPKRRVSLPVIVSVCPDRFSFAEAARFVGYPFRTMTEDWTDPLGPLHIVCVYRSVTDGQIRRHLGNPDIRVAKEVWGYFARDPERSIQSLYLIKCEDKTTLRERLHDALDWLASSELSRMIYTAQARGRILAATNERGSMGQAGK